MGKPVVFASEKLLRSSYQIRDCSGVNPSTDVMPHGPATRTTGEAGWVAGCAALEQGSFAAYPTHGAQGPPSERPSQGHPCGWRGL